MAGMKIPNVLKDANVYIEGKDWVGQAEIELPKLTQKTVEWKTMGISGTVELPLPGQTEKMEGTLKFKSYDREVLKKLYDPRQALQVEVYGSVQRYDPQAARLEEFPVKVTLRAFFKEAGLPGFKEAQEDGPEFAYSAVYYKLVVDGEEIVEADPLNYIYRVNGEDILAETRANLNMNR